MTSSHPQPGSATLVPLQPSVSWLDRHFTHLLFAIAAAGLIPCIAFGRFQYIGFDGWWHVFTATQDRWMNFLAEWRYDAHPPLFYLLLRLVAHFGHSRLILRSISIASGVAGSYVMGVVAGKICRYKASALLAALAYTFSWSMIEINCEVRSYPLALAFILLAFSAYLDWTSDPARAVRKMGTESTMRAHAIRAGKKPGPG